MGEEAVMGDPVHPDPVRRPQHPFGDTRGALYTVAAGMLFTNLYGEILLLETTYKRAWEIPGGIAERGETARDCARREVREELGLNCTPGRLLVVDFLPETSTGPGLIAYVFAGRTLDGEDTDRIVLQRTELKSWAWSGKGDADTRRLAPAPILASRLDYAQRALALGLSYDLVKGKPGGY